MPTDPKGTAAATQHARGEAAASGSGTGAGKTGGPIEPRSFPAPHTWLDDPTRLPRARGADPQR